MGYEAGMFPIPCPIFFGSGITVESLAILAKTSSAFIGFCYGVLEEHILMNIVNTLVHLIHNIESLQCIMKLLETFDSYTSF